MDPTALPAAGLEVAREVARLALCEAWTDLERVTPDPLTARLARLHTAAALVATLGSPLAPWGVELGPGDWAALAGAADRLLALHAPDAGAWDAPPWRVDVVAAARRVAAIAAEHA